MNATAQILGALSVALLSLVASSQKEYAVINCVTGILLRHGTKRECRDYLRNSVSSSYKARYQYSLQPVDKIAVPQWY